MWLVAPPLSAPPPRSASLARGGDPHRGGAAYRYSPAPLWGAAEPHLSAPNPLRRIALPPRIEPAHNRMRGRGITSTGESLTRAVAVEFVPKDRQTPFFQDGFASHVSTCLYSVLPTCDILREERLPVPRRRYSGEG
ncbi:hypothetical protein StrepF001_14590 [Streptomyces sp. F001]|nr:hypothetical protein StrepF001_14590 [Streptomyces sp. F001]